MDQAQDKRRTNSEKNGNYPQSFAPEKDGGEIRYLWESPDLISPTMRTALDKRQIKNTAADDIYHLGNSFFKKCNFENRLFYWTNLVELLL